MDVGLDAFGVLQQRLGPALAANTQGSGVDHVLVVLPSYSVSESILSHYRDRIPSLEHRYLNALLIAGRIRECHMLSLSTRAPEPAVVEQYLACMPADVRDDARRRITIMDVDDGTPRAVARKVLDRPDLIGRIRELVAGRPALIEPWNVTEAEVALALALDVPINGTRPELRHLGFKSEGRRLMRDAGVPVPLGREDVRTIDDVVEAILAIRAERPDRQGVVIKHDDSGAGDGNVVLDLAGMDDGDAAERWLRQEVAALPAWYLEDLTKGGIVEERIAADEFSSPSAQVDVRPDGSVRVIATHEQVLGGEGGQVYLGCRFPADQGYARQLAEHALKVGTALADRGVQGRLGVDFVTARSVGGAWDVYALEINLRKGGTTPPYATLRNIVPGHYDVDRGEWVTTDGSTRVYSASDNLVDASWTGIPPAEVIHAVAEAGLRFDPSTGTGVVLHMLSGLAIDGRMGLTAIARTHEEAAAMHAATAEAVGGLARRRGG